MSGPDTVKLTGPVGSRSERRSALRLALSVVRLGPLLVLAALVVVMTSLSDVFLTERNLLNVGVQASPIAVLAIGQFFVILTRGIDLSVGAIAAVSGVAGALVWGSTSSTVASLAVVLAVGAGVGLANGLLYVGFNIPHPFIVTLGTLNICQGAAFMLADGEAVPGVPPIIESLGFDKLLGVPLPILLVGALLLIAVGVLHGTQLGQWVYAIGGNPEAARRAGIPVRSVLISIYALSGLMAGFAAMIYMGRTASGDPQAAAVAELQSIAAVIIGGVSFFGGRGRVATVLVGALVLAVIANGLNLLGVNPFWQLIASGVVLIVAVIIDVLRGRIEERVRLAAGAN